MDESLGQLGAMIAGALPGAVTDQLVAHGELTIATTTQDIVKVATFLRDDERCQFWSFIDITAIDWPGRERRFDVVYHFLSPRLNRRIRVKIEVGESTPVPSIIDVYPGANWFERETYDMFGVTFRGHPDLRRILMYPEFIGHPLLKDYEAQKTQPLIPYRTEAEAGMILEKVTPFGADEGLAFGRKFLPEKES